MSAIYPSPATPPEPQSLADRFRLRVVALGAAAVLGGGSLLGLIAWRATMRSEAAAPQSGTGIEAPATLTPTTAAIAGGGLAWAIAIAYLSHNLWDFHRRRVMQPLYQVTQAARRLNSGDTLLPLVLPYADEWSPLIENLNRVGTVVTRERAPAVVSRASADDSNARDLRRLETVLADIEAARAAESAGIVSSESCTFDTLQHLDDAISQLEVSARTAGESVTQQADAIADVLDLVSESERSAHQSATEASAAHHALVALHEAIAGGDTAATSLSANIDQLQTGADRFVQRVQSLSDFVEVAERFVQDQSQIASLTQTLAMSASLLSARASAQRDPNQFLPLAMEFGAVAEQVQRLARQTSQDLGALRRRSTQVREAVAGTSAEVQGLSELVEHLSTDAARSRAALKQVEDSTAQATEAETAATTSQQHAIEAATEAIQLVREVAAVADRAVAQMQTTRSRVAPIRSDIQRLLRNLPAAAPDISPEATAPAAAAIASSIPPDK